MCLLQLELHREQPSSRYNFFLLGEQEVNVCFRVFQSILFFAWLLVYINLKVMLVLIFAYLCFVPAKAVRSTYILLTDISQYCFPVEDIGVTVLVLPEMVDAG